MPRSIGTSKARHLAALSAVVLGLTAVPSLAGSASADDTVVLDRTAKIESCNGVGPTPGSENTLKDLAPGSDLNPGGTVTFQVSYPNADLDTGDFFVLTDCFGVVDDKGDMTDVLDQFEITFTPNGQNLSFSYELQIPDTVPIGTQLCNWVKTTADPSAAQGSNRKGHVCFGVGGSLRVEKQDDEGAALWGAKFTVSCEDAAAAPDVVISGLQDAAGDPVTGNPVTGFLNEVDGVDNAIAIAGEEGAECTVTELQAPTGYVTPTGDDAEHTYVIPRGDSAQTYVIVNEPEAPTYSAVQVSTTPSGVYDTTTTWALAKTVDDAAHAGDAGAVAGTSRWTVTATKSVSAPSGHRLSDQTATLTNPNDVAVSGTVAVTVGGVAATVDCDDETDGDQAAASVPAAGTLDCDYSGTASGPGDTVLVTFTSTTPSDALGGSSGPHAVTWSENAQGAQTLEVSDDRAPADVLPDTATGSESWSYDESFTCPSDESVYDEDGKHGFTVTNTATADGVEPASRSVAVACTLVRVLPTNPTQEPSTPAGQPTTPRVLPFVPDSAAPTALPRTGADYLLPALALGIGGLLLGALLVGAGRRRGLTR